MLDPNSPEKEQSLKTLLRQLGRATEVYCITGSPYARNRACELIAAMRNSLNEVEQVLTERVGLISLYRDGYEHKED